ncbi:MAG: (2Fe-2S) ferredoxin domain-containing protein [Lachnospiraceae bacterium]|nr:(2Fe-2S) ferredoxin domain-containing protein [Lachnospiraceae bacterium]
MIIQVCIGSACHLKGSHELVELLRTALKEHNLEHEVALAGSFCMGKCNPNGVTVQVDETIVTGVTREGFRDFFNEYILGKA